MPDEAPYGYRYEWVSEDNDHWQVADLSRSCRHPRCGNRAVAAVRRKHGTSPWGFRWWYYCADHLYGRKIEDGVVKSRRLVKVMASVAAPSTPNGQEPEKKEKP